MVLSWRIIVKWLIGYVIWAGIMLGLTAGVVYISVSNYNAFRDSYPWVLLFEGFFIALIATGIRTSKEGTDAGHPAQSYETKYFLARDRFFMREELKNEWLFVLVGASLVGIGFFLLWLWNI